MVQINLAYNPFLAKTTILIEGKPPKPNSELDFPDGTHLHEWAETLPSLLAKEFQEDIQISFIGTLEDYKELESALYGFNDISLVLKEEKPSASDIETKIDQIFEKIQNSPIDEIKTKKIKEIFEAIKTPEFEVKVIATMSSGKSTLINALLGEKILPAKNEATTASIIKIKDIDGMEGFSAIAYDEDKHILKRIKNVTLKDMQELNDNTNVFEIDLKGDVKFVPSDGMSLVLIDTPGPNNSRDLRHQEMTFKILEDTDKSLTIFVMNGRQLGTYDEKELLDFAYNSINWNGKVSSDRFLFVVNQLDAYTPTEDCDGEDCINKTLKLVQNNLENRGFKNANIFPLTAEVALEKRIKEDDVLYYFSKKCKKYASMQLNNYYEFTHQTKAVREKIDSEISDCDEDDKIEYYTGIKNIEESIRTYVNKYARVAKIREFVFSFETELMERQTEDKLENEIIKLERFREKLNQNIKRKAKEIDDALKEEDNVRELAKKLFLNDYEKSVGNEIDRVLNEIKQNFKTSIADESKKVLIADAKLQVSSKEKLYNQYIEQVKKAIGDIIQDRFIDSIIDTSNKINKYFCILNVAPCSLLIKKYLGIELQTPIPSLYISKHTKIYDESYTKNIEKKEKVEGNKDSYGKKGLLCGLFISIIISMAGPWNIYVSLSIIMAGLLAGFVTGRRLGHNTYYEIIYEPVRIEKKQEYVDMQAATKDIFFSFEDQTKTLKTNALHYIQIEEKKIKESIKNKIQEIDKQNDYTKELKVLKDKKLDTSKSMEVLAKKLNWLIDLKDTVHNLINY